MRTRVRARKVRLHILPMPRYCAHTSPIKCRINCEARRISDPDGDEFCGEPSLQKKLRGSNKKTRRENISVQFSVSR